MDKKEIKKSKSAIRKIVMFAAFFSLLVVIIPGCKKDNTDKAHLTIRMTDAPANYSAVMVDVQGVEITGTGGTNVLLNTNKGIYNLLNFTNGLDTLIASGDIEAGSISQIRLILGENNTVVVNNVNYHLATPSAEQSGLKLQVHQTFEAGVSYNILLDFDASQSIVLQGNGEYKLKPVIRTINAAISGSIKGRVSPYTLGTSITATSNGAVYSTVANSNGYFVLAGLPAGVYNITVIPVLPLRPTTITGKTVIIGTSTDLGIIIL